MFNWKKLLGSVGGLTSAAFFGTLQVTGNIKVAAAAAGSAAISGAVNFVLNPKKEVAE
jgi:putative flippase GtrA